MQCECTVSVYARRIPPESDGEWMDTLTQPYLMIHAELTVGGSIVAAVAVAGIVVTIWTAGWCCRRRYEKRRRKITV